MIVAKLLAVAVIMDSFAKNLNGLIKVGKLEGRGDYRTAGGAALSP